MNIAFLASYNGSSAKAITDACLNNDLQASPTLMISNNAGSKALDWAGNNGLKTVCLNSNTHPDPQELDKKIADCLKENRIKLVVLSGYMKLIGPQTIRAFPNRILNVHPALLPKHGGQGMYGRHIHQAVKDNNESETGITIHCVDEIYDNGHIVAQKKVPLSVDDSVDDIENKVKEAEPDFYVETIKKILSGEINLP